MVVRPVPVVDYKTVAVTRRWMVRCYFISVAAWWIYLSLGTNPDGPLPDLFELGFEIAFLIGRLAAVGVALYLCSALRDKSSYICPALLLVPCVSAVGAYSLNNSAIKVLREAGPELT